jgi:recombination associated protein RdgC
MAWFKSMTPYRFNGAALVISDEAAKQYAFAPCGALEIESRGWIEPVEDMGLIYAVNGQQFMRLAIERKNLPKQVIDAQVKLRCKELEKLQGFVPGRKQTRELRENVIDELLPRAFATRSSVDIWIDPANGWLVVGTASSTAAEAALTHLIRSFDKFPVETLRTNMSPGAAMTMWLQQDETPAEFRADQDTELRSSGEGNATVRYVHHTLEADDMNRHIAAGKQCTRLALTWQDKISFVLTDTWRLKSIAPLDVLKETEDDQTLAGELMLMTGEFNRLLRDLVDALGGEMESDET